MRLRDTSGWQSANDTGRSRVTHDEVEKLAAAGMEGISLGATFAFRKGPDGSFSFPYASPIFEKLYSVSRNELSQDASPVIRSIHTDDFEKVFASLAKSEETLTEFSCEFRVETPAKKQMWLEGRAIPRRKSDGSVVWFGYVNGASRRKQAELAVRKSEQRFRAYFENSPVAIVIVDHEGHIVDCNPALQQILGYDAAALSKMSLFDLPLPEEREQVRSSLACLSTGGPVDTEVKWVRDNGLTVWVQLRAVALGDGHAIGFCEDITGRKRAELELLRSRELLEAFVDMAPVGIAMFDRNLCYIRSSRKWQAVMATTDAELSGRHHYDDLRPMPAKWIDAHRRGLAGETVKDEDEWLRPDGKLALHRWEVHPWGDGEIESGGIIIMFEDVTEARAMEAELRHAHKMEALGQLAGGVAHDFNNLLQIIQGYTQLLQEQVDGNKTATKFTDEVLQAARRASSLTRQLLAFSRRQVFTPSVIDLNEVIRSTSNMLRRLLGEDIDFHFELAESLWKVEADGDQLSQVVINLCVSARDAMPYGGSLTVATRNQLDVEKGQAMSVKLPPGDYVALTVQDTGIGMKASVLEHIFEPFFTTKDASKGTGLGLSTVYGIVRQSGGYVWADSTRGQGTRFTVCLPRTEHAPQVAPVAEASVSTATLSNQTVLVVEDDLDVRNAVAEYLPAMGYSVLAADPTRALEVAAQYEHTIDLLLIDVVMPETSGPVLAAKLRALRPGLRTVFMSGYIDDAVTRHGPLESGEPFLQKPFTLAELSEAIGEALGRP